LSISRRVVRIEGKKPLSKGTPEEEHPMNQYLLSIMQPDGDPPPSDVLQTIMQDLDVLNRELKAAGAWVFQGGLHPPSTATVVRLRDGELLITDGPYTEAKEHIGGFIVIKAPDLDVALEWGRKLTRATTIPTEVRPLVDEVEG
jgi:hypothetical protein